MLNLLRTGLLLALLTFPSFAEAANRFWVGGTGTWDNTDTTHWASTSGGAGGASVPNSSDVVTFDGSSGGGTVTVAATINAGNTLSSITCGAFTGTLDFATNNPSITMGVFSISGTGTRTINLGSGTFTINSNSTVNLWDASTVTGLTFNAGTSTIALAPTSPGTVWAFAGGGLTYRNATFTYNPGSTRNASITGSNTFNTLTINQNVHIAFPASNTQTITNLVFNTSGQPGTLVLGGGGGGAATVSIASGSFAFSWLGIRDMVFTGGASFSATNSWDMLGNSGITITPPSGGGGRIIGG